jgi:hypothetical protein
VIQADATSQFRNSSHRPRQLKHTKIGDGGFTVRRLHWKRELAEWMAANGGFIQYGARPRATDLLPMQAVDWLLACRNAAALGWVFLGRWLFLERADDARILADGARLATLVVDDTFRALSCRYGWAPTPRTEDHSSIRFVFFASSVTIPSSTRLSTMPVRWIAATRIPSRSAARSGLTDHRNLSPGVCRIRD